MTKKQTKTLTKHSARSGNFDGVYLLKLVLYIILGSMWLKVSGGGFQLPLPVGFIIGIIFASHEHFRIDRKIEYAALIISMLVGYIAPYGLYLNF
jgi:hypothetical protein